MNDAYPTTSAMMALAKARTGLTDFGGSGFVEGLDLTPDMQARLLAWHAENESGAHGAHRYTAKQYGLDAEAIRRDYAFYIERFGVACDEPRKAA